MLPLARRLHAERPFDLVDAQFFYPDGPAAATIARALGLPLSIKARGADIHYWGAQGYAPRQMLDAARPGGGLLAVSRGARGGHGRARHAGASKITVHYTGLDRALFRPLDRAAARAALAHARSAFPRAVALLATVGALIPRKGQALVIRALARLPGARLALAGTGPDEAALRSLAREAGRGRAGPLPRPGRARPAARAARRPPTRWSCPRPAKGSPTPGSRRWPAAPRW